VPLTFDLDTQSQRLGEGLDAEVALGAHFSPGANRRWSAPPLTPAMGIGFEMLAVKWLM